MRVAERQQLLSQYFFECRCQACLEELESGVKSVVSIRNSFCCPKCQAQMQVILHSYDCATYWVVQAWGLGKPRAENLTLIPARKLKSPC